MTTSTETQDITAIAIRENVGKVQAALSEFDKIQAGLASLELAHPKSLACDVATTKGMKEAVAGRAAWRNPRIATEKARQAAKAPVLALGKDIDSRAKQITALLLEGESNYDDQIKAEETRKEAERAAKIEAERKRVAAHHERISEILGAVYSASGAHSTLIAENIGNVERLNTDETFEEFQAQAKAAKDETIAKLQEMHAAAIEHEAEQARIKAEQEAETARIAAERAELDKLRAEAAERDRAAAAERADAEKAQAAELARQRQEQEAELQAQRESLQREMAAQREAQAEADAKAAAERKRLDKESAARLAEVQRQEEAQREAESRLRSAAPRMLQALKLVKVSPAFDALDVNAQEATDKAIEEATGKPSGAGFYLSPL